VEVRYNPEFKVTRSELRYLRERVGLLEKETRRICRAKIASFTATK